MSKFTWRILKSMFEKVLLRPTLNGLAKFTNCTNLETNIINDFFWTTLNIVSKFTCTIPEFNVSKGFRYLKESCGNLFLLKTLPEWLLFQHIERCRRRKHWRWVGRMPTWRWQTRRRESRVDDKRLWPEETKWDNSCFSSIHSDLEIRVLESQFNNFGLMKQNQRIFFN